MKSKIPGKNNFQRLRGVMLLSFCFLIILSPLFYSLSGYTGVGCPNQSNLELTPINVDNGFIEKDYIRKESSTFLTQPEWEIVFASKDYTESLTENKPSDFPFFRYTGDYWKNYRVVSCYSSEYGMNISYNIMLGVIGYSYSIENIARGIYEGTLGRIAEKTCKEHITEEEVFYRQHLTRYYKWLYQIPWYKYDFDSDADILNNNIPRSGKCQFRKLERRNLLRLEFGIKSIYGWLINLTYYQEKDRLHLIVRQKENTKDPLFSEGSNFKLVKTLEDATYLADSPRYMEFTDAFLNEEVYNNIEILNISGNDDLMVGVVLPSDEKIDLDYAKYITEVNIGKNTRKKRVFYFIKVDQLDEFTIYCQENNITLFRIYEY